MATQSRRLLDRWKGGGQTVRAVSWSEVRSMGRLRSPVESESRRQSGLKATLRAPAEDASTCRGRRARHEHGKNGKPASDTWAGETCLIDWRQKSAFKSHVDFFHSLSPASEVPAASQSALPTLNGTATISSWLHMEDTLQPWNSHLFLLPSDWRLLLCGRDALQTPNKIRWTRRGLQSGSQQEVYWRRGVAVLGEMRTFLQQELKRLTDTVLWDPKILRQNEGLV